MNDLLTGLGSGAQCREELERLAADPAGLTDVGLILADLDGFHHVNVQQGYEAGDDLLRAVAAQLMAAVGDEGPLYRLSIDEFALIVAKAGEDLKDVAGRVRAAFAAASGAGTMTASIGVASAQPDDGPQDVLQRAGMALHMARRSGPGSLVDAATATMLSVAEQEDLAVRTALRAREYELHFLPVMRLADDRAVGAETLVRWRRDRGPLVAPGSFLPFVRRSGLAAEFGAHVIEEACATWVERLRSALNGEEGSAPQLTINVDGEQAEQEGFDALVLHLLQRAGVRPDELVLEVTEGVLDRPSVTERLRRLRAAGVRISLDDFGSGPIVLASMRELPVDLIKIDQALVADLDPQDPDVGLIADIQRLAERLGLSVAVEGVETELLLDRLRALGIPFAQGYHFGEPCAADELIERLLAAAPVPPVPAV